MVSGDLRKLAAVRYGFDADTLRFTAGGREASRQFYSFRKDNQPYILRCTRCHAGQIGQTRAEMDWLRYLAGKGVAVPRPLEADSGDLAVLAEENGETCVFSAYTMAEGRLWDKNDPDLWNESVFHGWGRVMGDLHRETKGYRPAEGAETRPAFTSIICESVMAFPSINAAAEELLGEIAALPKGPDSYGLIHYDLNPYNFLIDGERVHVFDFDDCAYAWYSLDIGVALYTGLWFGRRNDAGHDFTNEIIRHFLRGYLSANPLGDDWLKKIPMFMRLCQIAKFSCAYRRKDPEDGHQKERMRNIENNVLFTGCEIDGSLFRNDTCKPNVRISGGALCPR